MPHLKYCQQFFEKIIKKLVKNAFLCYYFAMTKDCKFLIHTLKQAAKIVDGNFQVMHKGSGSDLVTSYDFAVEKFITEQIRQNYDGFDIVSEEFNAEKLLTKNCFVIDPIDGTINFANGIPLWGIQAACIKNGKPVAAVIYLPMLDECYYADKSGAYLNDKPIKVLSKPMRNIIGAICDLEKSQLYMKILGEHYGCGRHLGAASISYAYLAAGKVQYFIAKFSKYNPWDYVPGEYICKQAGAYFTFQNGVRFLTSNKQFFEKIKKNIKNI